MSGWVAANRTVNYSIWFALQIEPNERTRRVMIYHWCGGAKRRRRDSLTHREGGQQTRNESPGNFYFPVLL